MDDTSEMFDWEDEALEDRCLDLKDKVRTRSQRGRTCSRSMYHCVYGMAVDDRAPSSAYLNTHHWAFVVD